jgi:hypothetical protein
MTRFPRRAAALVLCALALAACGSSSSSSNGEASKPASQILTDAVSAAQSASSVRVSGSIIDNGQPVAVDLKLANGKGGSGSMTIQGAPVQIVDVNKTLYMKGSDAFWNKVGGGSAVVALLHGKWLKAPATGNFSSLASLTSIHALFSQLLTSHGTLTKGATKTVNGQPAIAITDSGKSGTIYVATTGKPYPLQLAKGGSSGGAVNFSQYGQAVSLSAPASSIDISKLQG